MRELDADFFEQEVWEAIKTLPSEKAPGPDGSLAFFTSIVGNSSNQTS